MKDCFLLHKSVDNILTIIFTVQVTVNFKSIRGQGGSACGGMLDYLFPYPQILCSHDTQCHASTQLCLFLLTNVEAYRT